MADDSSRLLRRALRANAAFSLLSGAFMIVADGLVAALLGFFAAAGVVDFAGLNLVAFGAVLVWLSRRDEIPAGLALAVVVADLAWVVGSWMAIAAGVLSDQGVWAVAIVADVVLIFAIVQFIGLRRMQRAPAAA